MDYIIRIAIQFIMEALPKKLSYLSFNSPNFRWRYIFILGAVLVSFVLNVMMFSKILSIGNKLVACRESQKTECVSDCKRELEVLAKVCIRGSGNQ